MTAIDDRLLKHSVGVSITETFAQMAFVDVTLVEEESADFQHSQIMHISILEPVLGGIALILPSECKQAIVENIYTDDWNTLHDDKIDDCLLEILNVIAGKFLTVFCGNDKMHAMSLPTMLFDKRKIDASHAYREFFFDAEGVPFKVSISVAGN